MLLTCAPTLVNYLLIQWPVIECTHVAFSYDEFCGDIVIVLLCEMLPGSLIKQMWFVC